MGAPDIDDLKARQRAIWSAGDLHPPSLDALVALFDHAFGPFIMARKALGDEAFGAILDEARAVIEEFDEGEGEPHIRSEYLLTIAHRP